MCAIEESISRISDWCMAVKKFAYDERSPTKDTDVHDSLQSTLTILGHKLRIKQIGVEKRFDASPSTISTRGSALSQVWTNLIDNAADASPANTHIEIATWTEPDWLVGALAITEAASSRDVAAHLRGVLHDQAAGLGNRLGAGNRASHRDPEVRRQIDVNRTRAIRGSSCAFRATPRRRPNRPFRKMPGREDHAVPG